MSSFARIAVLLATLASPPSEPAPVLLGVEFEVARNGIGSFALWQREDGWVNGADGYPAAPGYRDVGMLLDSGDVPFRTWVEVDFDAGLLSWLDGRFGVGFTPHLWLSETHFTEGTDVGADGTMRFEGAVTIGVRGTKVEEVEAVVWERGFLHAPAGEGVEPAAGWTDAVPVRTEGKRGPYRYTIEGTLHVDMHVYTKR